MRLLIAEQQYSLYAELVRQYAPDIEAVASDEIEVLREQAAICPIWLGQPDLLANLLRSGSQPQWLQSTWAGIRPLLASDLPNDYLLTRATGIFGQVMGEYVLCHLLAHERQLAQQLSEHSRQQWVNRAPRSLAGRRALIVGVGDIGLSVAQMLAPFGIQLHGIASRVRPLPPFSRVGTLDNLTELAAQADYIINLLPDTPSTHDLYDAAFFASLQPQALLINAGRGFAVVDEALVAALENGQLAAAVIDVCRQEPLPATHPFWKAPNLLLTGHSSAPTDPGLMAQLFVSNLQRWRNGETLPGCVDFARGY
ncbi:D-2-hydroxyacid dehydrogenase [Pseudomonas sp. TTU2014-080ASC]|uniref:D-2-hydroxyacid dehydrogenase n=1 Tax=Pseudomonas sp. TTU2014-080ASC TaxID=1729724 RepID=UPI00071841CE|nr:D-2-hydroxyacid dehydrogenase [Pseudomonas sp. TTU2014-080ASC]KRW58048.1 hydroxyacid dehydrogenase [Pseudomonas sp. TTU2014-080ASC]